jgi:hypothetical protein
MEHFNLRYWKPTALITFCILIGLALVAGNHWLQDHWGISFSIFSAGAFLVFSINQWLWTIFPFKYMFITPDFSGTYEGELRFDFKDDQNNTVKGTMRHEKVIHQNGASIVVNSWTYKPDGSLSTKSTSLTAEVIPEKDGTFKIICNYFNGGDTSQGFSPFYGTEVLSIVTRNNTNWLVGDYFTGRLPFQTRGKIEVEWKNKKTTHKN